MDGLHNRCNTRNAPIPEIGANKKRARRCAFRSKLKNLLLCFTLLYSVLLSPAQSKREYTFENGQLTNVIEANDSCELGIPGATVGNQYGAYAFPVVCPGSPVLSPLSNQPWLTINGVSGAFVLYSVTENLGAERNGIIIVAGKVFQVLQEGSSVLSCQQTCQTEYSSCGNVNHVQPDTCHNYCMTLTLQNSSCSPANNACVSAMLACGMDIECRQEVTISCGSTDSCILGFFYCTLQCVPNYCSFKYNQCNDGCL